MAEPDAAASSERLFVALVLGEDLGRAAAREVRAALGLRGGDGPPRHLRLYGGPDLHLTLFFLGAVRADARERVERDLERCVGGLRAPRLVLAGAGAFPDARRPRVLWLGVREASAGRLDALRRAVDRACVAAGFEADPRPFQAHVTVARVRRDVGAGRGRRGPPPSVPEAFLALDPGMEWQPDAVALVQTVRGEEARSGGAYRTLRRFPLEPAGAG